MSKETILIPLVLLFLIGGLSTGLGSCVVIQPRIANLEVGETVQLEASGNRDDAFTWATLNPQVATVDQTGLVTAVDEGTATITATGTTTNSVGRARIIVTDAAGEEVEVTPETGEVEVGGTFDFNATSTDPQDTFTWDSSNNDVATVDQNGTATGVSAGSVVITATGSNSGENDTATLVVTEEGAIEITLSAPSTSVQVGNTLQVTAASTDPLDTTFTWDSSDDTVATVDTTGLVTAVAAGPVVITATGSNSGIAGTLNITVTTEGNQVPTASAGPDQTVPANTLVTLDATGSSDPENETLTFAWTQTSGPAVTLSDPTAAEPSFTPPEPGTYVFSLVVTAGGQDSTPDTVTIVAENAVPVADIEILGISQADIEAQGLLTGESSGLNTVGVNTDVYLRAIATDANNDPITEYAWTIISAPSGSTAQPSDPAAQDIVFTPDLEGTYELGLTVSDDQGADSTLQIQVIHAALWVGAGVVVPAGEVATITDSTCTGCHNPAGNPAPDNFTPWLTTAHATAFAAYIEGEADLSGFCTDEVLKILTVGYDLYADNGGFDDVAADNEFTLPAPGAGVYANLVATQPAALMKLANVQCENCHGPASLHPAAAFQSDKKVSVSLDSAVCGQCHAQEREWEHSGHSDASSEAFTYPIGPTRTACVQCHSGVGYIDFADGAASLRTEFQTHTCAVCHDPHNAAANEAQLRQVDSVTLPGETVVDDVGSSASCMTCHNGRNAPDDALANGFPHYSTASENLMGVNAVDYGGKYSYPNSVHAAVTHPDTGDTHCVMCHMAPTPNDICDDNRVGGHTFALASDNGTPDNEADDVTNLANACQVCHPTLTNFEMAADDDYDGDGATESVQAEVEGLLAVLLDALHDSGVEHLDHYPYWSGVTTDAQRQAIYNYELVNHDGSQGVHNTKFSVSVLQATFREFTGADVPDATIIYQANNPTR